MVRLISASPWSPLFLLPGPRGCTPLTKHRFVTELRCVLSAAGVDDPSSFRGHSFRRGAASWAFNHGVPGELIQLQGDWTSDAYKVYLELSVESTVAVAHHIRTAVRSLVI